MRFAVRDERRGISERWRLASRGCRLALLVSAAFAPAQVACSSEGTGDENSAGSAGASSAGKGSAGVGQSGSTAGGGKGGGSAGSTSAGTSSGGTSSGGTSSGGMFEVSIELSSRIQTVGIVTFSASVPIDSAVIDFGRDQSAFEYQAPVDLTEPENRTLLLGMKPSTTYFARITAKSGATTYTSDVYPVMTGFLPNGLPVLEVEDENAAELYAGGGFTVQCTGLTSGGFPGGNAPEDSFAFIFDKDGEQVWAYELTDTSVAACSRARMSVDGKYMWAGNFNNVASMGMLMRVSMDGLGPEEDFSIPARNHDFAFLPNGHILYWEQQNGGGGIGASEGADIVRSMDPETLEVTDIYDQLDDFADQIEESGAHTNQINYVPELDAISFSMRHSSTVALISYPEGELMTVFGGPTTHYSNMDWDFQHGHHVRADTVFIFNNSGSNGGSSVLGFTFDMESRTATETLDYSSGRSSGAFGDVKELENGNLYVTYSTSGVIHEISSTGALLREITTSASLGYSEHRATLYGPPPPFDED